MSDEIEISFLDGPLHGYRTVVRARYLGRKIVYCNPRIRRDYGYLPTAIPTVFALSPNHAGSYCPAAYICEALYLEEPDTHLIVRHEI